MSNTTSKLPVAHLPKWVCTFIFVCIAVLCSAPAMGAISELFPGVVNRIADLDREWILDSQLNPKTAGILDVGDRFVGVAKFEFVENQSNGVVNSLQDAPDTITAIFLIEVIQAGDGMAGTATSETLAFGPAPGDTWNAVFGTGGPLDMGFGASPFSVSNGTMIMVYEGVDFATATDMADPIGASAATFVGNELWQFGFTAGGGAPAADEFWNTIGVDADNIAALPTNSPVTRRALNLTANSTGLSLTPHDFLGTGGDPYFTGPAQLQGIGSYVSPSAGSLWPIGTDTNIFILPVPEPGSLLLMTWGLVAAVRFRLRKGYPKAA